MIKVLTSRTSNFSVLISRYTFLVNGSWKRVHDINRCWNFRGLNMLPYCLLSKVLTVIKCSVILAIYIWCFFLHADSELKGGRGVQFNPLRRKIVPQNIGQKQFFFGYIWIVESLLIRREGWNIVAERVAFNHQSNPKCGTLVFF